MQVIIFLIIFAGVLTINNLAMERIKDLSKVILRPDGILAEIVEEKSASGLVLPDSADRNRYDYMRIIAKGEDTGNLEIGDIILHAVHVDVYDIDDKKIARMAKNNISIAVKPDNFDLSRKKSVFTSKIIK